MDCWKLQTGSVKAPVKGLSSLHQRVWNGRGRTGEVRAGQNEKAQWKKSPTQKMWVSSFAVAKGIDIRRQPWNHLTTSLPALHPHAWHEMARKGSSRVFNSVQICQVGSGALVGAHRWGKCLEMTVKLFTFLTLWKKRGIYEETNKYDKVCLICVYYCYKRLLHNYYNRVQWKPSVTERQSYETDTLFHI